MNKIIIAPDSFKGTMTSIDACNAIEKGIRAVIPDSEIIKIPIADGGEGTCEAYYSACKGSNWIEKEVCGPEFKNVKAKYVITNDMIAIIETASAAGLTLIENKNPSQTTTYGVGQLILDALDRKCKKIIIGLGGSGTNDGGIGLANALGVRFLDNSNREVPPTGKGLETLVKIDIENLDKRLVECEIYAACDVDNVLYGKDGAAFTFAKQKGADDNMILELDKNMKKYADIIKKDLNLDVSNVKGAGAAGGLGACLVSFLNAKLVSGIDLILDIVGFENQIKNADLIITGEGSINSQTKHGKVPVGISRRVHGIPVLAIVGDMQDGYQSVYDEGITSVFSINHLARNFNEVKDRSIMDLTDTVINIFKLLSYNKNKVE